MTHFNTQLLDYVSCSPTPFHAVANAVPWLLDAGYQRLNESDDWVLSPGGKYFVTRRDSSLIAFKHGAKPMLETGIRILGAHTDSPCLKVKSQPDVARQSYHQVGVEVYGGVLLAPWFDRDLSIAGQVSVLNQDKAVEQHLIDLKRPVATIPSLAIHLDRNANNDRSINAQEQMLPILWQAGGKGETFRTWLLSHLASQGVVVSEVLDFDLSFYDAQAGASLGVANEFLACARLDNLLSCFVTLQSLLASAEDVTNLVVLNDHEEVGSRSTAGAAGNFLTGVLDRLLPDTQERHRVETQSMMMSVDNAHGVHPNFVNKHDGNHGPKLNDGPVLKFDANQSYASQSVMASRVRVLARNAEVPLQDYVTRADMRCGSTIGPITATLTGIETLDIGVPTFAMHSIRELAGAKDPEMLFRLLTAFLNDY
ncbi:aspartyl aminopeptidase [Marinagarivorans cellulosilyticus]|uniref:M18 family aminopeptidase n=2 Tax=Marinagarivorans cellulosilyticus TaxID=2721545 RepID=A0AAN1WJ13_9GAMM|nr:M18 family aminopeptidase [Marinagarivorans cellulosilyticus]BCD98501.1 aspartyl aminopeptidase [Marinagarivorans cellulosilyticus]